ncbi:DNA-dependent metalloprotease SPRTN-like isoform X2 [Oryza brachyantha]|uniref:DNA-dependent metalloprotease SPRTN-like isoform X2 n=1 Tax=Oryza brachyantha TaxID=4533 RepID=UPI00077646BE|nr:DNA-dependent metalloprotease SPRTN-like isoform X2 [Oryza brachyantha]
MDEVVDPDLEDPNPDVGELFRHYDGLYFRGALAGAGFSVRWSSPQTPPRVAGPFGSCIFEKPDNTITLSEPVLKYRSSTDTKNALLHQMIHAILFVKHHRKDCRGHGPIFRAWMTAINSCSVDDHQRPPDGYNITTRHDFSADNSPRSLNSSLWKCEYCGDTLVRAMNMGAPSDACCIENVDEYSTCGNMLCHWHNHKMGCDGTYANMGKAKRTQLTQDPNNVQGTKRCPTDMQMAKSQIAIQEPESPDSDGLQQDATVRKPEAEGKLLTLGNVKSTGRSSSKKGVKRHRPENTQDVNDMLTAPLKNPKLGLDLVSSWKRRVSSIVGSNNAKSSGGSASRKESKPHMPENVEESSVLPSLSQKKLKLNEDLVVSGKNETLSLVNCSNGKSAASNSSKKVREQHELEGVQKSCVQPASPPRKLRQDFVASVKTDISSLDSNCNAKVLRSSPLKCSGKQHEKADIQKSGALPSGSESKLKRQNEISSSTKAGVQDKSRNTQKNIDPPASPQTKLKQSVLQKQRQSKTRKSANEKFAVISAWLNYYESEGSSGSTEPLVNKRTERRRRARNRITYTRSRKRNAGVSSSIKTQPSEDGSSHSHAKAAASCLDIVASIPSKQVVNQSPRYQSQSPAPFMAIVPFDAANADPTSTSSIIDISDDD